MFSTKCEKAYHKCDILDIFSYIFKHSSSAVQSLGLPLMVQFSSLKALVCLHVRHYEDICHGIRIKKTDYDQGPMAALHWQDWYQFYVYLICYDSETHDYATDSASADWSLEDAALLMN